MGHVLCRRCGYDVPALPVPRAAMPGQLMALRVAVNHQEAERLRGATEHDRLPWWAPAVRAAGALATNADPRSASPVRPEKTERPE